MNEIAIPDLASSRFKADPYPFYARLRAEAPVWRTTLRDKRTAWMVTRYEDVAGVLKDDRIAKDPLNAQDPEQRAREPWVPGFLKPLERNMLDVDDPDHRRLRTLVSKAFTPRLIERLRQRIERICRELLDEMERNGKTELVRDYALPLPATVIAELLGIPASDHRKFHRWSNRIVSISSGRDVWKALPAALSFLRYLRKMAERRRSQPEDDLMSALVQAEEAGDKLSQDELLAMAFLLLVAGHETTVNLIANGTLALIEHPDTLDLTRDPNKHLAFGRGGVHHCLGAPLARMEGQIALTALLRRFPEIRVAVPHESLRWHRGLFLRGLERLPLILEAAGRRVSAEG